MAESVSKMKESLTRAKAQVARIREKAEETMSTAKTTVETVGVAFGFGYLRGRMTDPADEESFKVAGVEPDLLAGVGMHALAFLGGAGKYSEDMHAMANGALASFAVTKGVEIGLDAREESEGTAGTGRRVVGSPAQIGAQRSMQSVAQQMASAGAASSRAGA